MVQVSITNTDGQSITITTDVQAAAVIAQVFRHCVITINPVNNE